MKDLVIVGHGGLAREVAFLVEEINRNRRAWNLRGYIGAGPGAVGLQAGRYAVCGEDEWLVNQLNSIAVAIAVGNPVLLPKLHARFSANPCLEFPALVHPSVTADWANIELGPGNLVLNGAALTTDISLGGFNVLNPGCTVAHDCRLGSYNVLGPGTHLAGAVTLGSRILAGTGAQILPGVRVCDDVRIGAGAVVARSITQPGTYAGVPARPIPDPRAKPTGEASL